MLVAEGTAIVMSLIQTGKIEAIVGVSCLSVLERAFPYMEAAAIPGVAVPLLQDDCIDTTVDLDWVWEYIHLTSDDQTRRLDLGRAARRSRFLVHAGVARADHGAGEGETEQIAREWLEPRRQTLAAVPHRGGLSGAARRRARRRLPEDLRKIAVAVECFHKASLIHDDIEDNDAQRYGEKTLHEEHGVAVALNVGDLLIGEGYRLLAESATDTGTEGGHVCVAAGGQRELCRGQGAELCWARRRSRSRRLRC